MIKSVFKKFVVLLLIMSLFCANQGMAVFARALNGVHIEAKEQLSKYEEENNDNSISELQETVSIDTDEIVEETIFSFVGKDGGLKKEELEEDIESVYVDEDIEAENNNSDTMNNVFATPS